MTCKIVLGTGLAVNIYKNILRPLIIYSVRFCYSGLPIYDA